MFSRPSTESVTLCTSPRGSGNGPGVVGGSSRSLSASPERTLSLSRRTRSESLSTLSISWIELLVVLGGPLLGPSPKSSRKLLLSLPPVQTGILMPLGGSWGASLSSVVVSLLSGGPTISRTPDSASSVDVSCSALLSPGVTGRKPDSELWWKGLAGLRTRSCNNCARGKFLCVCLGVLLPIN